MSSNHLPSRVKLVEMGPRDGLQNEPQTLATGLKVALIERLAKAGHQHIEATSFVSPRWVPQMADAAAVMAQLKRAPDVTYRALTPNLKGLEAALAAGVDEVAVFAAASETFSQRNINCSVHQSLARFEAVIERAQQANVRVRGYVSTVMGCPYEGHITPQQVADVSDALYRMGCYEISLGDTIGTGTPLQAKKLIEAVSQKVPMEKLAAHFHDTYGQALANLYAVLEEGVAIIDASVAGVGGCPYAKGASGNVATEDVVYMLEGLGIESGLNLPVLASTGVWISAQLGRVNQSKVGQALSTQE